METKENPWETSQKSKDDEQFISVFQQRVALLALLFVLNKKLKNQRELCFHPTIIQSPLRRSVSGLGRTATVCFSSCFLYSACEWERRSCICARGRWFGCVGVETRWRESEFCEGGKRELQRKCAHVCLSTSQSFSCLHTGNAPRQPGHFILYMPSLSHTHNTHSQGGR